MPVLLKGKDQNQLFSDFAEHSYSATIHGLILLIKKEAPKYFVYIWLWLKKLGNSFNFHLNVEALHWKNAVPDSYSIAFPEKIIQVLELLKRDILIVYVCLFS